jgi:hypothetical protein
MTDTLKSTLSQMKHSSYDAASFYFRLCAFNFFFVCLRCIEPSCAGCLIPSAIAACPPPSGQPKTHVVQWVMPFNTPFNQSECTRFCCCIVIALNSNSAFQPNVLAMIMIISVKSDHSPVYTGDAFSVRWNGQNHNVLRVTNGNAEKIVLDLNSCTNPNTGPQCNFVIPNTYSCNEVIKLYCGEHPGAMFLTIGVGNVSSESLSATPVVELNNYRYAHGVMMFLAFGILLPIGGFLAQSGRIKCDEPLCDALRLSVLPPVCWHRCILI